MSGRRSKRSRTRPAGQVRIIAGQWRGRRLPVPDLPGLRPSGDRARETLFSWLNPWIAGARCLDLFAGTGALGLEALSRGADSCVLVESQRAAVLALRESIETLDAGDRARLIEADALRWLGDCQDSFDIVFLDPPYALSLWRPVFVRLPNALADTAWIYCESPAVEPPDIPAGADSGLTLEKLKTVGAVEMRLFRRVANG